MVAIDEKSMPNSETDHRRTQPLVSHLYQGMALDAVTGLCYERIRLRSDRQKMSATAPVDRDEKCPAHCGATFSSAT